MKKESYTGESEESEYSTLVIKTLFLTLEGLLRYKFLAVSLSVIILISMIGLGSSKLHVSFASTETLYGCIENASQGSGSGGGLSKLYTISTSTGVATLIGATGFYGCEGLAFSPSGVLYSFGLETQGGAEALYRVNIATGAGTVVGQTNATTGGFHMTQLAFQPGTGTLFSVWEGDLDEVLFTVNPNTAQTSEVGQIANNLGPTFRGGLLAFAPDGTLYWSTCVVNKCNASYIPVDTLNPTTAVPTFAFALNVSSTCTGPGTGGANPSLNTGYFDMSDNFWFGLNCYGSNYVITGNDPPAIDTIGQTVTSLNGIAFLIQSTTTTTQSMQQGGICCYNSGTSITMAATNTTHSSESSAYSYSSSGFPLWILVVVIITIFVAAPLGIYFRRRRQRHF